MNNHLAVILIVILSACGMSDKDCQQQRLTMKAAAEQQRQDNIDEWHQTQLRIAEATDADTVLLSFAYLKLMREQLVYDSDSSSKKRALANYFDVLDAVVLKDAENLGNELRNLDMRAIRARKKSLDTKESQQKLTQRNALVEPEFEKRFAALGCKCEWNESASKN